MPHFKLEAKLAPARVCGVDEAGCGPWAGPVVAAAVIFTKQRRLPKGIDDSKKLTRETREALYDELMAMGLMYGVGIAQVEDIDTLNIWGATQLAMRQAVKGLTEAPDHALIDGKRVPRDFPCAVQYIVGGDGISMSIAAASIIAKVTRDRMMHAYAEQYPHYGFERHAGYGTAYHQQALATYGPCPIHRTSFAPIRALLQRDAA